MRPPALAVAFCAAALWALSTRAATTWHVDVGNDTGTETGSADFPFNTIQEGIDAATAGDTVLVHDGLYTGDGNRDLDFKGKPITVRSQNGPDDCIIDCEELGCGFHFGNGETAAAVLDGLTITGGRGRTHSGGLEGGGGIYCENASPTITGCVLVANRASMYGGAILSYNASPTITDNLIRDNVALGGGGIYCRYGAPTISRNTVTGNRYSGIFCYLASPTLIGNTIHGNQGAEGGGIQSIACWSATVANNTITGNTAQVGGGIGCHGESFTVSGCTLAGNRATSAGGGFYCYMDSAPTLRNCILWANEAPQGPQIGVVARLSNPDPDDASSLTVTHCDVQGGGSAAHVDPVSSLNWGVGNLDADPLFVDPGHWDGDTWVEGDYHLTQGSPCINAGDNAAVEAGEKDIDGEARIQQLVVDMGADETDSVGAPNAPGPAELDDTVLVGGRLNANGPGPKSVTLEAVGANGNPAGTLYAIWVEHAGGGGWARSEDDEGRIDLRPDGTAPEWFTADELAGKRVRGLEPATAYTFQATCKTPPGVVPPAGGVGFAQAVLSNVGSHTTSGDCDVNRSGTATALDYAYIRAATLSGGALVWPCDVNDDAAVDVNDLNDARERILNP